MSRLLSALWLLLCLCNFAHADVDISKCDRALVIDTYKSNKFDESDWRLATLVDEESYKQVSQGAGLDTVIYGAPVKANWDDYRESRDKKINSRNESFLKEQARSIAWKGLGDNATHAYEKCIESLVSIPGLMISGKNATETDVEMNIRWNPGDFGPQTVKLEWDAPNGLRPLLPKTVTRSQQGIPFSIRRPKIGFAHLVARVVIGQEAKGGSSVVIAGLEKPLEFSCERLKNGRCVRCSFDVKMPLNPAAMHSYACIKMPRSEAVSMSFTGKIKWSKIVGTNCWWNFSVKYIDGKTQEFNTPDLPPLDADHCEIDVSVGPTSFQRAPNDGYAEAGLVLGTCHTLRLNDCVMTGELAIFTASGQK